MTHKNIKFLVSLAVLTGFLFSTTFAYADETQLMSVIESMQKQMKEMQKLIEQQNVKITGLEQRQPQIDISKAPAQSAEPAQMSDKDFNDRLGSALGGAEKWLKDLKFGGDLRLRYEAFANKGVYPDADRNRFRFRLRYGFEKKILNDLKIGFSMASGEKTTNTGHNGDPTSTNQTLGNLADFKNIWIEKAYASYAPTWTQWGPIAGTEITGGKFTNPFEKGSSDLIWDRDLKPEGAYEKMDFKLWDTDNVKVKGYATVGQYILQENAAIDKDSEMFGYQLGINPIIYTPFTERPVEALSALSYYDYYHYDRNLSWRIDQSTSGQSLANGNSVCSSTQLCTGFRVWDYYAELALYPFGIPFRPFGEYAYNTNAGQSMRSRNAWSIGTKFGKSAKKGDWEISYAYKYIGADSVPGAFNDSDFGYRGYSGNKGHVVKLAYNLTDNFVLNAAAWYVRNLDIGQVLDPTATTGQPIKSEEQLRFQLDTVYKF